MGRVSNRTTDQDRITYYLTKTAKSGDCLEWSGCLNTDGYPRVSWKGNANGKLHRIIYQVLSPDEDISNKVIRHTCDNPKCINPQHLLSGTSAENVQDRVERERSGSAKLSHDQVKEIRSLFKSFPTLRNKDVALRYGVDSRTISSIKLHRHFKHVIE